MVTGSPNGCPDGPQKYGGPKTVRQRIGEHRFCAARNKEAGSYTLNELKN